MKGFVNPLFWGLYALAFLYLVSATIGASGAITSSHFLWTVGVIASWRYAWQILHFIRGEIYKRKVFPKWRALADEAFKTGVGTPESVLVVVTSYQMTATENHQTYDALFKEAFDYSKRYGVPTTLVASVTDQGDADLVDSIFRLNDPPDQVSLITQLQAGTGKRDAIAAALRAGSARGIHQRGVTVLMDGDTELPKGSFEKSFPFFAIMPDVGAITLNNTAEVRGNRLTNDWYMMRFALRNLYMCSLSLSRKVLCLTGRFSVFRSEIITDEEMVNAIENDVIHHWRLGSIKCLTGDDKTTWYHCLKNQWSMIYLPDTPVICVEELPPGGFFKASSSLMTRWFGNMLRNSDRSIMLGPKRMGFFTWWCLIDQRLSIWTAISGPVVATIFVVAGRAEILLAYGSFVLFTRFVQSVNVAYQGGTMTPYVPFLLLHQQLVGAAIKIYILFRLDRQKWTRQAIATGPQVNNLLSQQGFGAALNLITVVTFVCLMSIVSGVVKI